ncbi:MAG: phage tail sheath subtilisin-like domain-containing protein [Proteobacteria bacterium]|nr:phage tail sheath subtilisin-like domain-containing protein [Pseudomonadota bacterium]
MAISFLSVPTNLRVPGAYAEFDPSHAMRGLVMMPYKVLVFGQLLATGTKDADTLLRVTNASDARAWFGPGSQLAHMLETHFANNTFTETYAVGLDDDGSAVAATGTIALTGTATAAGTLSVWLGGRRVRLAVASGDTAAEVATALAAAINADTDLAVTAAADSGTVTVTARNKGLCGNDIDIRLNYYSDEATPAGISAAITAMASGATNPDISGLIALLGDEWFNILTCPYTDAANLTALETELAERWGPLRQIEGHAIAAAKGTHSALGILGDSRNSPHLTIMDAHDSPTPPWQWAAGVAAVGAYYGNIDPARPFQTLPVSGLLPELETARFTIEERNLLLFDGISTHTVDAGGVVRVERLITTYKTDAYGTADTSLLDANTVLTLGYIRYDLRASMLSRYPRHKLADDGTRFGAGQAVITPSDGKAFAVERFRKWELVGLVEGFSQFKNDLIVERNATDPNRLDWLLPPDLVNQLRVHGVQIQFLL